MLPSEHARIRDRNRHGPRRAAIVYRCWRCEAEYDAQPYLPGTRQPGCAKCSWLGYLNRVRVRD